MKPFFKVVAKTIIFSSIWLLGLFLADYYFKFETYGTYGWCMTYGYVVATIADFATMIIEF